MNHRFLYVCFTLGNAPLNAGLEKTVVGSTMAMNTEISVLTAVRLSVVLDQLHIEWAGKWGGEPTADDSVNYT